MPDPAPPRPRWRLDAAALTALAAALALGTALATHPPLTGADPALGPGADFFAGRLAAALGFAAFVCLAGWLVVTALYVALPIMKIVRLVSMKLMSAAMHSPPFRMWQPTT